MYKKLGFREIEEPSREFRNREPRGERWMSARRFLDDPSGEMRMRLDIQDSENQESFSIHRFEKD